MLVHRGGDTADGQAAELDEGVLDDRSIRASVVTADEATNVGAEQAILGGGAVIVAEVATSAERVLVSRGG